MENLLQANKWRKYSVKKFCSLKTGYHARVSCARYFCYLFALFLKLLSVVINGFQPWCGEPIITLFFER